MPVRVIRGEIGSGGATIRTILPNEEKDRLPPFERVVETIVGPRRRFPPHRHERVEVLTYVTEGAASYLYGTEPPDRLGSGAVRLLSAPTSVSHAIDANVGATVRWFAAVATLPAEVTGAPRLQATTAVPSALQSDGTIVRPVVGSAAGVISAAGMEGEAIEFRDAGTAFRRVGHDRVAIGYAVTGVGRVENETVHGGEAALVEDAAGIAIQGKPGLRIILLSAPRSTPKPR
jgi:redox-sensitive bicupin YhaK (pirin superfamily)